MSSTLTDDPREAGGTIRPNHIPLPPPFSSLSVPSPSHPYPSPHSDRTPESPFVQFFTAPSSPYVEREESSPQWHPNTHSHNSPPSPPPSAPTLHGFISTDTPQPGADYFPAPDDLGFENESLTALEKIYLFSQSNNFFHRVFIIHAMPAFLYQITPQEAVDFVLPLLSNLALDKEEQVREALAQELARIIWWFLLHCDIVSDESAKPYIHAQAFTPILGTLLLSSSPAVGGATRGAVVTILARISALDGFRAPTQSLEDHFPDVDPLDDSHFPFKERQLIKDELVQSVVLGMGKLDHDTDLDPNDPSMVPIMSEHTSCTIDSSFSSPTTISSNLSSEESLSDISSHKLETTNNHHHPMSQDYSMNSSNSPTTMLPHNGDSNVMNNLNTPDTSIHTPSPPLEESHAAAETSDHEMRESEEEDILHQGSVGRLSSMSLMAAVVASGYLSEETQETFVHEVVRVSQDPVFWVRKEASFALGALVKVVPERSVKTHLLPVFDALISDSEESVRHSTLFALPGLLSRLNPEERSSLALKVVLPTVTDPSALVRSGLLEALGEIIHSFHLDPCGPPSKLVELFLGKKEDLVVASSEQLSIQNLRLTLDSMLGNPTEEPTVDFFHDPRRPFICAFNLPAVASTLKGHKWPQMREIYLQIASSEDVPIQRTLSASLGELAKIIGPEFSQEDLLPIWTKALSASDEDVKSKAVESTLGLTQVVQTPYKSIIAQSLLEYWRSGSFSDWRTREKLARSLSHFASALGGTATSELALLIVYGLKDNVFAVRQATISCLPTIQTETGPHFFHIQEHISPLLSSPTYRHRITFISCQDSLSGGGPEDFPPFIHQGQFWHDMQPLVHDPIPDVRIAVARFAGHIISGLTESGSTVPLALQDIVHILGNDSSNIVRSFVNPQVRHHGHIRTDAEPVSTFSRPP